MKNLLKRFLAFTFALCFLTSSVPLKTNVVSFAEDAESIIESDDISTADVQPVPKTDETPTEIIQSDSNITDGVWGDNITYKLNTDTDELIVSGTGDIKTSSSTYSQMPFYSYKDIITSAVFEEGITSICNYGLVTVKGEGEATILCKTPDNKYNFSVTINAERDEVNSGTLNQYEYMELDNETVGTPFRCMQFPCEKLGGMYFLMSDSGEVYSYTSAPVSFYSFSEFNSETGSFYMETYYDYYSWEYHHPGRALNMGVVVDNQIYCVSTSNSFLEQGIITSFQEVP